MPLKIAVQMDPIESISIKGDSTFAMLLEAQHRGHEIFYYVPKALSLRDGKLMAPGSSLELRDEPGDYFTLSDRRVEDLSNSDVILLRQDPPFDMSYITTTHLLEQVHPKTLVVNDPAEVRNAPEKIFVTRFPEFMPPTLITRDRDAIRAFKDEFGDIILKPLFGNGGAGVFRLSHGDENLASLVELFEQSFREPFIVQKYLPEVRKGDKRVILVDGKAVGAINRVPALGEARSNMHVGGRAEPSELTRREHEICEAIGPELKQRGLIFVGIDVIGDWLTEINVTSPTGIREVKRFGGADIAALIWDAIEDKR
ncbi:glutathione synthase [Rhodoligotrophos appendicifer]|uniref:glutathione synthase n=1 Tax=Rhodoligotrophos appendicifer TaxID=987056 RepID=UPI00117CE433|nr:glutathione synthase [Rhodoligotrophos appendicifer]